MQQFSSKEIAELKSRIDEIHDLLATRGEDEAIPEIHGETLARLETARQQPIMSQLMYNIQMRRLRKTHFDHYDLSGPAWDMLLDMMLAERHGKELSASDLATGANVPLSSGLRMIASLEDASLARRFIDQRDRRRSLVRLTDKGRERMTSYFEQADLVWRNSSRAMS